MTRVCKSSEGTTEMVCPGAVVVPVPARLRDCALPPLLSITLMAAMRVPTAEGVKVTRIVQLAPAAIELPQLFVCAKLLAFAPESVRLVMPNAALPGLFKTIICAGLAIPTGRLPNPRLVAERLADTATPVPETLTVCGLPLALSATLRVALLAPLAEGAKLTDSVQWAATATELPQLLF